MKLLKLFVVGLLFCFALTLSDSVARAQAMYPVVSLTKDSREILEQNAKWKICGGYLAAIETSAGKVVHFTFETVSPRGLAPAFVFPMADTISVSINPKLYAPVVTVFQYGSVTHFVMKMNLPTYIEGLPCFSHGGIPM